MGDARPRLRVRRPLLLSISALAPIGSQANISLVVFSFGAGYPYMVAHCPTYTTDPNMVPLNIASDRVYDFLLGFIAEMTKIFPDEFVHTVRPIPTSVPGTG